MDDYGQAIRELERQIEQQETEIKEQMRKLGEHLSYQDPVVLNTEQMNQIHQRIQELRKRLPASRQQVKQILQTVAGNQALERELREQNRQLTELARKNEAMYEGIGTAVFQARGSGAIPEEIFGKLFDALERKQKELAQLEQEIENVAERRSGRLFGRIGRRGREAYLKGLLSIRQRAVSKTYQQIGKNFCDFSSGAHLNNARLRDALEPFEANNRKAGKLQQQVEQLSSEREAKWRELKSLGANRSHQRRVREIESEIQQIETQLEIEFQTLGSCYIGARIDEAPSAEVAALQAQLRENERSKAKKLKQIERLQAAVQIVIVEDRLGTIAERITRLEEEIESRRNDVKALRAQIQEGEQQLQKLQRVRGSRQSLHSITEATERTKRD